MSIIIIIISTTTSSSTTTTTTTTIINQIPIAFMFLAVFIELNWRWLARVWRCGVVVSWWDSGGGGGLVVGVSRPVVSGNVRQSHPFNPPYLSRINHHHHRLVPAETPHPRTSQHIRPSLPRRQTTPESHTQLHPKLPTFCPIRTPNRRFRPLRGS
ncbi:hypothetical protein BZA05DRAFT_6723 [Tricharina praecox]|uniref:uncharacterized protein n=1 Tax=Tricharina praecox TaxID=43433 RepID=UPI0022208FC7|nr:uncharacterized protein BZA05DRAFT_6723 [Tricharina praecox]KAI5858542.1 hypothetical protein BZA05DRAFT_6723 [Tricharina praecox]